VINSVLSILLSSVWHYGCQVNGIFAVLVFHEMHN